MSHRSDLPRTVAGRGRLLALLLGVALAASAVPASSSSPTDGFDAVPFGEVSRSRDGKETVVQWEDAREIFRVVVEWRDGAAAPDPERVHLDYWQSVWPGERIPREESEEGVWSGWTEVGDWFQGEWREADTRRENEGKSWTYRMNPLAAREFPDLDFDAVYRTTMKLRVRGEDPLPGGHTVRAYTASTLDVMEVAIEWGGTADSEQVWDGSLEVFNGHVEAVRPLGPSSETVVEQAARWRSSVAGRTDGVRATLRHARTVGSYSFDRTVVTVRADQASFSFSVDDLIRRGSILIPAFGVLVKPGGSSLTYEGAELRSRASSGQDLYSRVAGRPEQTFAGAWESVPEKSRRYIALGFEGGRQHFRLDAQDAVHVDTWWLDQIPGKDSGQRLWEGEAISYRVRAPGARLVERTIVDGDLPIVETTWEQAGVRYERRTFVAPLAGVPAPGAAVAADDTLVLMMRIRMTGSGPDPVVARLETMVEPGPPGQGKFDHLTYADGLVLAAPDRLRLRLEPGPGARLQPGRPLVYEAELPAGGSHDVYLAIPYVTLTDEEDRERLLALDHEAVYEQVRDYWRKRIDAGSRVHTPEPMIDDFYRAHASHLLINTEREVGSDRRMPRAGTFRYGVYANEAVMMLVELDRRGYHDVARAGYETFLHYQGTVGLPGDFSTSDGQFYGAGGYEAGGYNQHHGWTLWGLAEHYLYTGDRDWLDRVAPALIEGCDWIVEQRRRSDAIAAGSGLRAIEKGLLPPGGLEDIGDWRSWLATNAYSWRGLDHVARVLSGVGHPEAPRLVAESKRYRGEILAAYTEAMRRAPVVPLRDGSWVPHVPCDVHRRGRSFGWITETLEGALHLVCSGVLSPHDPVATWIIRDYEDNLYLSREFGYELDPETLERRWFDWGGISKQANLLCNPSAYLLRGETEHFLRAYFNAFAVSYFPDTRMMTEHALPRIGGWVGDHFKAPDEANSAGWLRSMFLLERADALLVGYALPRGWLADGEEIGIERAVTHFGTASVSLKSSAASGSIEMILDPPRRSPPREIRAYFRHPEGKPILRARVDGQPWSQVDREAGAVVLPARTERTTIVAYFDE